MDNSHHFYASISKFEASSIEILEKSIVSQLLEFSPAEDLKKIYQSFIRETGQFLTDCHLYIEKGTWMKVERMIHTLKGNAGTLGANRLYFHAIHAEKAANQREEQKLIEILSTMDKELYIFQNYLNNESIFQK